MSPTTQEKRVATMELTRAIDAATTAINLGDEQAMNAAANALTKARNAGTIQRWTMRPGTKTYRLCAVADDLLGRIGDAMRAAKEVRAALPKAAPSLREVLVMRDEEKRSLSSRRAKARSDRARAMNAQVDGLGARELPIASSRFRKFVWGARTFVLETVAEDDAGGIDGFEVWVLASETNLLGRTFANLRRILEGDTVDVAVAASASATSSRSVSRTRRSSWTR